MVCNLKCFYINLESEAEKNTHMKELCARQGIDFYRVSAINGALLENKLIESVYNASKANKLLGRSLTAGEIGCALSHLSIYKRMVKNNIEVALILEDDVVTAFSGQEVIKLLDKAPKEWDCILLGHHPRYSRLRDAALSYWRRRHTEINVILGEFAEVPVGGYAYLISIKGARKRLVEFEDISKPIDMWDGALLEIYGVTPSMFKIHGKFDGKSVLDVERASIVFHRSPFQSFKDGIRALLTKLNITWVYFFIIRLTLILIKRKNIFYKPRK